MNVSVTTSPNSKENLQERLKAGDISWVWPLLIVFARLILAVLAQALIAGVYKLQGNPTPWQAAAPWWIVYGTLIDLGCLILLVRLARQEGIRLFDLLSFERQRLVRNLLIGVGLIVVSMILFVIGGMVFGSLIYGASEVPTPMQPLPLWGTLYSLLVWPIIWAFAEELTYFGYAFPRIEVLSGRAWLAMFIVSFGWGIQHIAMPLMDWRWALYRFAVPFLLGIMWSIFYLRLRRLLPFIIAHWAMDFVSVLTLVVLPLMAR